MAKISTYPSADVPLLLSDRLIGTEAIRPIPSATPLATKNFSLGELLQFFQSQITVTTNLQAVLNAGNIATQNINLTGTISSTLIKPVNIEDTSGSQGTVFQVLSKGAVSITWANVPIDNLQAVLNAGNTATQNITLIGDITSTKIIPGNIQDDTSAIGTIGQFLSKTASGIRWVNAPLAITPTLGDVVAVGDTANQDIFISGLRIGKGPGTGSSNTALGNTALSLNTTGYYNVATGAFTLSSNTVGNRNTAIGYAALYQNISGNLNVAIGSYSQFNGQTALANVSLGYGALQNNIIGNFNTALGYRVLNSNKADKNTAIGAETMFVNQTGIFNTVVGQEALRASVAGSYNSILGNFAILNAEASFVSALGRDAGRFSSVGNLLTANESIFIGFNSKSLNTSSTNEIVIGANAVGEGDNTVTLGHTTITSTRLRGAVKGGSFVKDAGTGLQYLMADGSVTVSPLTTKGDLYTFDTAAARLPVGLDTQVLLADSTTPTGLKWGTNTAATPLGYYGAFSDVTDQLATVINTGYPMLLGVTDLSNGVTVVSGSRVTIANTGIYNIQWSAQFRNPTANEHDVTIWLRKNGVDVPGSSGVVLVPKKHGSFDGHNLPSWNFLLDAIAGDYYEFVWSTQDTAVFISFESPIPPAPSTASVVLTVTQQSGIMAGTGVTNVSAIMTNPSQTVVVTNPTTIPEITIDDTNFMYNKFFVNQYSYILPKDTSITFDTLRVGGTLLTTGTVSALAENPMGVQFTTATAVSSLTGFFGTNFGSSAFFGVNFTFDFSYRFRFGTNNGAQRFFAGLSQMYGTATPTNIEPTAMINSIGVAKLQGSANLFFIWNDATGTASSLDLGSDFLGTDTASTYRIRIWKISGIPAINIQLTKVVNSTGVTTTTSVLTITSDYNTGVNHHAAIWMGNNTATTGAVSFKNYGCELSKRNLINA